MSRQGARVAGNARHATGRTLVRFGLIASLAMALVITGAGVTFALWNSSATVSSEASTASLELSAENFSSTDFVFRNDRLASLGSVTITNTTDTSSDIAADLALALDTDGGSAALAAAITVSVWSVTPGTNCGAPTGTVHEGTWALFPTIFEPEALEQGEQAKYCISSAPAGSERSELASTAGSLAISPRLTATLTVGSFNATAVRTASQGTSYIFPAVSQPAPNTWHNIVNTGPNNLCVDVEGGDGPAGTTVINFGCKNNTDLNQDWGLVTTSYDPRYVNLQTRYTVGNSNPQHLVIGTVDSANTTEVQILDPGSHDQQWQFQLRSTSGGVDTFQIVNRASGLCLEGSGTEIEPIRQQQCDGSARQGFTLDVRQQQAPAIALACETSGTGVTYSWTGPAIEEYELGIAPDLTTFIPVKTVPFGAESIVVEPGDVPTEVATGMHNVVAKWRGVDIGSSQLWVERSGSQPALACDAETDIEVTATSVTPATVQAGVDTPVEWTFTVANHGPLSSGLEVMAGLPASGYAVTSTVGSCVLATCTIDSLAPGAVAIVTVTGTVNTTALGPWSVTATTTLTGGVGEIDDANNAATGSVMVEDTTAPDAPTDLAFSGTTSQSTTLTWTAPYDNVGVASYTVYRDGVQIASGVSGTSYPDTGLQAETTYAYTVVAVDGSGNASLPSAPASVTTAEANVGPSVQCSTTTWGVQLTWEDTGADNYFARWRSSSNGAWSSGVDVSSDLTYTRFAIFGDVALGSGIRQIQIVAEYGGTDVPGNTVAVIPSGVWYSCSG